MNYFMNILPFHSAIKSKRLARKTMTQSIVPIQSPNHRLHRSEVFLDVPRNVDSRLTDGGISVVPGVFKSSSKMFEPVHETEPHVDRSVVRSYVTGGVSLPPASSEGNLSSSLTAPYSLQARTHPFGVMVHDGCHRAGGRFCFALLVPS